MKVFQSSMNRNACAAARCISRSGDATKAARNGSWKHALTHHTSSKTYVVMGEYSILSLIRLLRASQLSAKITSYGYGDLRHDHAMESSFVGPNRKVWSPGRSTGQLKSTTSSTSPKVHSVPYRRALHDWPFHPMARSLLLQSLGIWKKTPVSHI